MFTSVLCVAWLIRGFNLTCNFASSCYSSGLSEKLPRADCSRRGGPPSAPPHNIQQPSVKGRLIQVSGLHHFPGSEVGVQYQRHPLKGTAEDVLPTATAEAWPTTRAVGHLLHCCHPPASSPLAGATDPCTQTTRHKNSFFPSAITLLNC